MNDITNTTSIDDTEGNLFKGHVAPAGDETPNDGKVMGHVEPADDVEGNIFHRHITPANDPGQEIDDDVEGHSAHGRFVRPADEVDDDVEGHAGHARF